jgi:shikimate kinase
LGIYIIPNVILIGMPACGKSITGVVLAKTMRNSFIDTDLLIQEKEERPLQDIINENGNDYYRKVEEEVLCSVNTTNSVISTGGSAIYYDSAMKHLKEQGTVVYLKVSLETIESRLDNIKTRGVTMEKGATIATLYDERIPLYEKYADVIIEADGFEVEDNVAAIINAVSK